MLRRLFRLIAKWLSRLEAASGQPHFGREIETLPATPVNPEVRFEANDIRWQTVLIALAAITVTTLFLMFLLWAMLQRSSQFSIRADYSIPSRRPAAPRTVFEGVTSTEVETLQKESESRLSRYGWADRDKGRAIIPIDRAIEILVKQGPPKWPAHHHGTDHDEHDGHSHRAGHEQERHDHAH